jgi:HEPN domain-containing protein
MSYATSHLAAARTAVGAGILWEIPCFEAQQAAEKAIKAVLISVGVKPPRVHDIGQLLDLVPPSVPRAAGVEESRVLTQYAFVTRYPGGGVPVSEGDYRDALGLAEAVVEWAEGVIG